MHVVLTTCTPDKAQDPGLLPAVERYRGPWVDKALARSRDSGCPLFFLSGVYGIIPADEPLPLYDHALQPEEVDTLVIRATAQLQSHGITTITALLRPPATPGWAPYHQVLEASCQRVGLALSITEI